LPSGSQWLHEIKHDGFRIIARKDGARVRLEFRTAAGEVLAISIPRTETAVIRHFQERMPYGLFVPDMPDATAYTLDGSESV